MNSFRVGWAGAQARAAGRVELPAQLSLVVRVGPKLACSSACSRRGTRNSTGLALEVVHLRGHLAQLLGERRVRGAGWHVLVLLLLEELGARVDDMLLPEGRVHEEVAKSVLPRHGRIKRRVETTLRRHLVMIGQNRAGNVQGDTCGPGRQPRR